MSSLHSLVLDRATFSREIFDSGRPAVVGFSAEWCTPCRSMSAVFTNLSRAFSDRVLIGMVDIDEEPELVEQLSVGSVPTLLFFEAGFEVKRILRTPNEAELELLIEQVLLNTDLQS